jgi:hypothetical protein
MNSYINPVLALSYAKKHHSLAGVVRSNYPFSMLSDEEVVFLDVLLSDLKGEIIDVAELGAYVGGTTCIFAQSKRVRNVHVFDMFQHNPASRRRLKDDPLFNENSFFPIWSRNTDLYKEKIKLYKGDLLNESQKFSSTVELLYVDIVKHPSLVNIIAKLFYPRLQVGGILIHQDYFHWQSPWLVYQMEFLRDYFDLVGDAGYNMTIYVKKKEIPNLICDIDYLRDLDETVKMSLFDRAIDRYDASKKGMLHVSKLAYAMSVGGFKDSYIKNLQVSIADTFSGSPRVMRYLDAAIKNSSNRIVRVW